MLEQEDDPLAPEAIENDGYDLRGTVFVVPLDAPLPNELSDIEVPSGSLYQRLYPLAVEHDDDFSFLPITGSEMLSLERVWRQLQIAKKVAVLSDLPGARYDIIFNQAKRQIGLRTLEWPVVSESIARRIRTLQRTKDSKPWLADQDLTAGGIKEAKRYGGPKLPKEDDLDIPEAEDENQT